MTIRTALPKGRLLNETAAYLENAGWQLAGYDFNLRNYRLSSARFPEMQVKVFQEKDIPVQVAIGNYDLGICGLDWVRELSTKFAGGSLVRLKDLGYGRGALWAAGSRRNGECNPYSLRAMSDPVRIVSEYPNVAETFALEQRLRRFSVYPVWGAAEAYPPESATLALVAGSTDAALVNNGLSPVARVLDFSACLIANRHSWEQKDLSRVLSTLEGRAPAPAFVPTPAPPAWLCPPFPTTSEAGDSVRIALADGHQQKPTIALLKAAGIEVEDYPSPAGSRRPVVRMDGVFAKVVRPQDMPAQVANGNFDLAITGRDWLADHLSQFPSSPVRCLADLKYARVRLVAVVHRDVPAGNLFELRQYCLRRNRPLRVASEYTNLSDRYARENRLGLYRIIPTWGATEAFLPEDADLLIENTETGSTIARHNLKIIDTLFESTGCLIGNTNSKSAARQALVDRITGMLAEAAGRV